MKVKFVDIAQQNGGMNYQDVMHVIRTGQFMGSGDFEERFASYNGAKYCVGVGSGTDALILSLLALGIGPGDKVIVPANTYIATVFAVSHTGAEPVFCDVDPHGYIMTYDTLSEIEMTKDIKAIIPVHLYGQPCHMQNINDFAFDHDLFVVEDCAQATGAEVFGKKVGTYGDAGCFSFYPTKNLGGLGQGGAVITNNEELAITVRELGNVGREEGDWYKYSHIGYNSRLDAINAKFLMANLRFLDQWNNKRIGLAKQYEEELSYLYEVFTPAGPIKNIVRPVYHLYELKLDSKRTRTWLNKHLEKNGISTGLHYPIPCHHQPMYKGMKVNCPVSEELSNILLSLPMHPYMKPEEVTYVCDKIKEWFDKRKK
jgi:dTDP-4-amino-4,6-dideoxygalactose transaminase